MFNIVKEFSFCESATSVGPWHIRQLTKADRKLGGGIDTPSLCERIKPAHCGGSGGWDIRVEVAKTIRMLDGGITAREESFVCGKCREIYKQAKETR